LEALLRLPAHRDGFVPPSVFIPLAEEMGLIDQIGHWTIRRACRIAVDWPEHLAVAVNLSPANFLAGNVSRMVEEALAESRLDPRRLEVEITENMLLSDTDAVMRELRRIKALGVKIVMDDFGKGYSSLSYLWRFPFDAIKIDGTFMQGLETGDRNVENIVSTIVTLGRSLDLTVTAEGVENEKQLEFLRRIDCDQVQGFLFGQPAPATEVSAAIMADYLSTVPAGLVPSAHTRRRRAFARVN
jgi:EAL domain-containing protein (putative c-di-GMP-specific phosphodiesterase class I)